MSKNNLDQLLHEAASATLPLGLIVCQSQEFDPGDLKQCHQLLAYPIAYNYAFDPKNKFLVITLTGENLKTIHYLALCVQQNMERAGNQGMVLFTKLDQPANIVEAFTEMQLTLLQSKQELSAIRYWAGPATGECRVLLMQEDINMLEFLKLRLSDKGFNVLVSPNNNQALEKLEQYNPHIFVTDLSIPGMDGLYLLQKLMHDQTNHQTKVMVLSDNKKEDDIIAAFELGAADYLTKPFSPMELEARIVRLRNNLI